MIGDTLQKAAAQEAFSATLTFDGVSNLVQDMIKAGRKPYAIVLSYHDRRALNQDVMGQSKTEVAMDDQNRDDMQIAFVQGVQVGWNRDVARGKCVVLCNPTVSQ